MYATDGVCPPYLTIALAVVLTIEAYEGLIYS